MASEKTKCIAKGMVAGSMVTIILSASIFILAAEDIRKEYQAKLDNIRSNESDKPEMTYDEYSEKLVDLRIKVLEEDLRCEIVKAVNREHQNEKGRLSYCTQAADNYPQQLRDLVKFRDYYLGKG